MDPAEKDLLQRNLQLTEENNRMLHKMRRAQLWGSIFKIVWWLVIFGVSGVFYYYYLWPYMQQVLATYQHLQQSGAQAQDYLQQFSNIFTNLLPHASSTAATTTKP